MQMKLLLVTQYIFVLQEFWARIDVWNIHVLVLGYDCYTVYNWYTEHQLLLSRIFSVLLLFLLAWARLHHPQKAYNLPQNVSHLFKRHCHNFLCTLYVSECKYLFHNLSAFSSLLVLLIFHSRFC